METPRQGSLPYLSAKAIMQGFQFAAFRLKHQVITNTFDTPTADYIDFIYSYYPCPSFNSPSFDSPLWRAISVIFPLTREGNPRTDISRICFHVDWAVDRPSLNREVREFLKAVESILLTYPPFLRWQKQYRASYTVANPLGRQPLTAGSRANSRSPSFDQLSTRELPTTIPSPIEIQPQLDLQAMFAQIMQQMGALITRMMALEQQQEQRQHRQDESHQYPRLRNQNPRQRSLVSVTSNNGNSRSYSTWKPSNIGFFYPDMPISWGSSEIVDKEDKVYYRTVHGFTNRLRMTLPFCQNIKVPGYSVKESTTNSHTFSL
jgi:hypothetical protein